MTEGDKHLIQKSKTDELLKLCKHQGYVPPDCYLDGYLVFAIVNKGQDPCRGCNLDRAICKGRPK